MQVNPEQRLTISAILERVAAIAETNGYNLKAPLQFPKTVSNEPDYGSGDGDHNSVKAAPPRPVPPSRGVPERPVQPPIRPVQPNMPPVQQKGQEVKQSGLFSSLKGGAGSFLKNLKDTSSKVMATVQQ